MNQSLESSYHVRFAPSPTGNLHLGSLRTALYNWLLARKNQGQLILRIEDTDQKRSEKKFTDNILESLKWLGLDYDLGPIYQSQHEDYISFARELIDQGLAYEDDLDKNNIKAIYFKIPQKRIQWEDQVFGSIDIDLNNDHDFVIMKSDGMPTYNFACVVDDHRYQITHVLRGEDHLTNTARQIALYDAFGWRHPIFVHLSMILGPDGQKFSKRHGAVSVSEYEKLGIMPQALINYLAFLGWNPKTNQEIFSLQELTNQFDLKYLNRKSAIFDFNKLYWMNSEYISQLSDDEYLETVNQYLDKFYPSHVRDSSAFLLIKKRIRSFEEIITNYDYLFNQKIYYDSSALEKWMSKEAHSILFEYLEIINRSDFSDSQAMEKTLRDLAEQKQMKPALIIHPLRVAIVGKMQSPGIFETMQVIGKEKCIERIHGILKGSYELA